jgi:hypothetical protein
MRRTLACNSCTLPPFPRKKLIPSGWDVRIEDAVRLADSEPEPEVSVARGEIEDYADRHPGPADLAMVVEVAGCRIGVRCRIGVSSFFRKNK